MFAGKRTFGNAKEERAERKQPPMDTNSHEFASIGVYSWFKIEFFPSPRTLASTMLKHDFCVPNTVRRKLNESPAQRSVHARVQKAISYQYQ